MTVDVGVDSVKSLENLTYQDWEGFWKGHAWHSKSVPLAVQDLVELTYPAREHRFVVDITLDPCHQMLDIFRCRHLGRSLEVLRILPEIFEPIPLAAHYGMRWKKPYSSVAFISGHDCGEQNSVMEP